MTGLLQPLAGYIPAPVFAPRVIGPPTAMLTAEQREEARSDPLSFRHAAGRGARSSQDEAVGWLTECRNQGVLLPVGPAVFVYQQEQGDFIATGVLGDLALDAYDSGQVKKHEKTIAKTQRKMAEYMRTTRVYGNPAVTSRRPHADLEAALKAHSRRQPDAAFTTVDNVLHKLWIVDGDSADELCRMIESPLYITDGHHRLAAASLVASEEGRAEARLPVGVFSAEELRLRSFARCIIDPDLDADAAIARLESENELEEVDQHEARPRQRYELGAKVGDRYFRLRIPRDRIPDEHYASLNINLLQELILGPVFGIDNPRLDKRLRFVADLHDTQQMSIETDAWLLPFPLRATDVMEVADSERAMPPKSTWFTPKLPSGLLIRPLDEA